MPTQEMVECVNPDMSDIMAFLLLVTDRGDVFSDDWNTLVLIG